MRLTIHVRELELSMNVGKGSATFRWLGAAVAARYATEHDAPPKPGTTPFYCIHMVDADSKILFPADTIRAQCPDGAHVHVELRGSLATHAPPTIQPQPREKSLWELYAYTPAVDYVSVRFELDADEAHGDTAPAVFGNFNNWGAPVPMRATPSGAYQRELAFPVDAQLVFKFTNGTQHFLGKRYAVVTDPFQASLNYLRIRAVQREYRALQGRSAEVLPAADAAYMADVAQCTADTNPDHVQEPRFHVAVPNAVSALVMTDAMHQRLFQSDWHGVHIDDVVPHDQQAALRNAVKGRCASLNTLFAQHASHHRGGTAFMSSLAWFQFCAAARLIDGQSLSGARVDHVFRSIVTPEPRIHAAEAAPGVAGTHDTTAAAASYFASLRVGGDPFDGDNQFLRAEFYEALCRVAILRFGRKSASPAAALEALFERVLAPFAKTLSPNAPHLLMLNERVQAAIEAAIPDLFSLFDTYAVASKRVGGNAIAMGECARMLYEFDLLDEATCAIAARTFHTDSRTMLEHCVLGAEAPEAQDAGEPASTAANICYAEFLDVLCRIGIARSERETGSPCTTAALVATGLQRFLEYCFPRDGSSRVELIQEERAAAAAAKAAADALARKKRLRAKRLRLKKERLRQKMIARGELPPDEPEAK